MKKNIRVYEKGRYVDKEINYIPGRYIVAVLLTIIEVALIIGILVLLAYYIPYFYLAIYATVIGVVISIIGSNDNPDYKVPWLLFVIILPIAGFMLYFIFHERKLPKRIVKRLNRMQSSLTYDDDKNFAVLKEKDSLICSQAYALTKMADTHLYRNTKMTYYYLGEHLHQAILEELKKAKKFIFLEYFIIEEGLFWNSILEILKEKAKNGVEVKLVYDDIGCMGTLPGSYYRDLNKDHIDAIPFSKLKGQADGEFNNRSHRKILVIDGLVGFTGGVNIADEYINKRVVYGHWKDTGIKLEGKAVNELTKLFLTDYFINIKSEPDFDFKDYYVAKNELSKSFVIPFGDGPYPVYAKNVGKTVIMNILNHAKDYVYINTPYLILDNEMLKAIENTALRGVDVRILVPHIPDKKLVFELTRENYQLLMKSGVRVYEYEPGFVHAKSYISDDKVGMIGTINLDYRSLTHHFENGVWIYDDSIILDMKKDYLKTLKKSILMNEVKQPKKWLVKFIRKILKIFAPLL